MRNAFGSPRLVKASAGLLLLLLVIGLGVLARPAAPATPTALPPGPGAERINRYCLTCHEADIIVEQRLTRALWGRELDKMARWGATWPPEDREVLLTYLATHFGDPSAQAASPASSLPAGRGAEAVKKNCLTCHEADIIVSQSLTRAQWGRELDKMARWGAVFSPEDRDLMVEYLASHFGPERIP